MRDGAPAPAAPHHARFPHAMPREVTDADGTTWSCVQLYANLSDEDAAQAAAERAADAPDHVAVVCTPSGGAQSVRVELPTDWEEGTDDATLADAIAAARAD